MTGSSGEMDELVHQERLSPNFDERNAPVEIVVLHYTEMLGPEAAIERMCDPQAKVSAHYLIAEDGTVGLGFMQSLFFPLPSAEELTRVFADRLAPPTPGGYRLRCWAPPANASLEGATPRLDMLLRRLFTRFTPFSFAHTLTV